MTEQQHFVQVEADVLHGFSHPGQERLERELQAYATALINESREVEKRSRTTGTVEEVIATHVEEARWNVQRRLRRRGRGWLVKVARLFQGLGTTIFGVGLALLVTAPRPLESAVGTIAALIGAFAAWLGIFAEAVTDRE